MPTYICRCDRNLLDVAKKSDVARVITDVHSEITGAPAYFAQVHFCEVEGGNMFIGGRALEHDHIFIEGRIRSGRSAADREALIKRLVGDVAAVAGVETFAVWVYLLELPPAAMAEFGHILPEPGDETAWADALPNEDRVRMQAISS